MGKGINIKIDKDLLNLSKNERRGLVSALNIMGDVTENEIRKIEVYVDRSGDLRRKTIKGGVDKQNLSVKVIATVGTVGSKDDPAYGIFVNDGTKHIKARRFMEKGLNKASPSFERTIVKELDKFM